VNKKKRINYELSIIQNLSNFLCNLFKVTAVHFKYTSYTIYCIGINIFFFFPLPPQVHIFLWSPPSCLWPKCNRLLGLWHCYVTPVTLAVPAGTLSLKSTSYPDEGHHGDRPLLEKIPMAGPGIEPGTSWLVVRSPDHQATRLVTN
jgi:hypothetical protein